MKTMAWLEGTVLLVIGLIGLMEGLRLAGNVDPDAIRDVLGPGYYIFALGIILMATGTAYIVTRFTEGSRKGEGDLEGVSGKLKINVVVFYMLLTLTAYLVLINIIGYLIPTLIFFFLEFRLVGVKSWKGNAILTALVTLAFYLIFIKYCRMVFPYGIILG